MAYKISWKRNNITRSIIVKDHKDMLAEVADKVWDGMHGVVTVKHISDKYYNDDDTYRDIV